MPYSSTTNLVCALPRRLCCYGCAGLRISCNTLPDCCPVQTAHRMRHTVLLAYGCLEFLRIAVCHWEAPRCGTTCSSASRKSTVGRHCRTTNPEQDSIHCQNCSSGCVSAFAPALTARHSSREDQPLPNTSLKCARSPSSSKTTAAS